MFINKLKLVSLKVCFASSIVKIIQQGGNLKGFWNFHMDDECAKRPAIDGKKLQIKQKIKKI